MPVGERMAHEIASRVGVRFIRSWNGYNAGDVAGWTPKRAEQLIRDKYAKPFPERGVVAKVAGAVKKIRKKVSKKKAGKKKATKGGKDTNGAKK